METAELQGQNEDLFTKQSNELLVRLNSNFCNQYFQSYLGNKQKKKKIQLKLFILKMPLKGNIKCFLLKLILLQERKMPKEIFPSRGFSL